MIIRSPQGLVAHSFGIHCLVTSNETLQMMLNRIGFHSEKSLSLSLAINIWVFP